jgi:hypothetical protein
MLGLSISATAQWSPIIPIDVTGAGTAAGQGTYAYSVNDAGAITGWYVDASWAWHGFVRAPNGFITPFEAPNAGTAPESYEGTVPYMINQAGWVVGYFEDSSPLLHGFLRAPDGTFITVNAPDAGTIIGPSSWWGPEGTALGAINNAGWSVGVYEDTSLWLHSFLRAPDGKITEFNVPNAGTGPGQGTFTAIDSGISAAGTIAGEYLDKKNVWHSFVRAPDGTVTEYHIQGSVQGDEASDISPLGAIVGWYYDWKGVGHGYLRAPDGAITTFEYPGAATGAGQGTLGFSVNDSGLITGQYIDSNGAGHGYLRTRDGSFVPFDAPGAGTGSGQGTVPIFINSAGAITGYYIDADGVVHGFLRLPMP